MRLQQTLLPTSIIPQTMPQPEPSRSLWWTSYQWSSLTRVDAFPTPPKDVQKMSKWGKLSRWCRKKLSWQAAETSRLRDCQGASNCRVKGVTMMTLRPFLPSRNLHMLGTSLSLSKRLITQPISTSQCRWLMRRQKQRKSSLEPPRIHLTMV